MKEGDFIYFIRPHKARYSTNEYDFKLMTPYLVVTHSNWITDSATVEDIETKECHFITNEAINKTISHIDFIKLNRGSKLKELGIQ